MIYFLENSDGFVKIGISRHIAARKRTLEAQSGRPLKLVRTIDGPNWIERWLHDHYRDHRLAGEWFSFQGSMLTVQPPNERPNITAQRMERTRPIRLMLPTGLGQQVRHDAVEREVSLGEWLIEAVEDRLRRRGGEPAE